MAHNTCTMASPLHNGKVTAYWNLMMFLQSKGATTRAAIVRNVKGGDSAITTLYMNGMATSVDRMWELTPKGKSYIAQHQTFVNANKGKPFVHSPNTKKMVLKSPIINNRPTKFWLFMSLLYNAKTMPDSQVVSLNYKVTAQSLQQAQPVPMTQYNRTTREWSLTADGIAYCQKHAATVQAKLATPTVATAKPKATPATSGLAPLGSPCGKFYVSFNGATFAFHTMAEVQEFAKSLM